MMNALNPIHMKKFFIVFVCGLLLLPLLAFADDDEGEEGTAGPPPPSFEEGGKRPPKPMLFRHEDNREKQDASHIKRLEHQLKQIHEQIERLKEKAEEIKKKMEEGKNSGKADWKMDDDRYETEEVKEMRRGKAMGKKKASKVRRRWQQNRDEEGYMGNKKEMRKRQRKLDANIFSSDLEKSKQRNAEAKKKMKRFWNLFR